MWVSAQEFCGKFHTCPVSLIDFSSTLCQFSWRKCCVIARFLDRKGSSNHLFRAWFCPVTEETCKTQNLATVCGFNSCIKDSGSCTYGCQHSEKKNTMLNLTNWEQLLTNLLLQKELFQLVGGWWGDIQWCPIMLNVLVWVVVVFVLPCKVLFYFYSSVKSLADEAHWTPDGVREWVVVRIRSHNKQWIIIRGFRLQRFLH
jgi:hypothetical protein